MNKHTYIYRDRETSYTYIHEWIYIFMCIQYTDEILYRYSQCNILYKATQTPRESGGVVRAMRTKPGWLWLNADRGQPGCSVSCFMHQAHTVPTETWYNTLSPKKEDKWECVEETEMCMGRQIKLFYLGYRMFGSFTENAYI